MGDERFFGYYRGTVLDNDDRQLDHAYLGRVQVYVPQVYGKTVDLADMPWAWPSFAYGGGRGNGNPCGYFSIPPVGASVWVVFEHGDPGVPIWAGTMYGERDATPEIDSKWVRDVARGVEYPDIHGIRWPVHADGVWIRCVKDKAFEIVWRDGKVYLEIDDTKTPKRMTLKCMNETDLYVETDGATMDIRGKDINLQAEGDLRIRSTKSITISAEKQLILSGNTTIVAGVTAIHGRSPHANGFDYHTAPPAPGDGS